jgi:uncharacterized membrane protein YcaP (DUF421 family)
MDLLTSIFGEKGNVTVAQECARAVLILIYGLAILRVAGRRIFGKWSALDIIVSIIVGSNLSRALTGNAPLLGTIAATTVLIGLHWLLARLAAHYPALSRLVEGRSIELGRGGEIDVPKTSRYAATEADLNEALRQAGIEEVGRTAKITLEPSGKISVLKER